MILYEKKILGKMLFDYYKMQERKQHKIYSLRVIFTQYLFTFIVIPGRPTSRPTKIPTSGLPRMLHFFVQQSDVYVCCLRQRLYLYMHS